MNEWKRKMDIILSTICRPFIASPKKKKDNNSRLFQMNENSVRKKKPMKREQFESGRIAWAENLYFMFYIKFINFISDDRSFAESDCLKWRCAKIFLIFYLFERMIVVSQFNERLRFYELFYIGSRILEYSIWKL